MADAAEPIEIPVAVREHQHGVGIELAAVRFEREAEGGGRQDARRDDVEQQQPAGRNGHGRRRHERAEGERKGAANQLEADAGEKAIATGAMLMRVSDGRS
jgi:hypothetical protein